MSHTVLHIDASARQQDSVSRRLSADIVAKLGATEVIRRDLAEPLPLLDEGWVTSTFIPPQDRTDAQAEALAFSDTIVEELQKADTIVIGTPIYNFSGPAVLKAWVDQVARAVAAADRSPAQREALEQSDTLIQELKDADTLVIGVPVYNFSVPASLKAWIDLIARAGETFRYTENGPVGLLADKKVIVAVASGGVQIGSPADFLTPHLKVFFGFLGLQDVSFVNVETVETLDLAA